MVTDETKSASPAPREKLEGRPQTHVLWSSGPPCAYANLGESAAQIKSADMVHPPS